MTWMKHIDRIKTTGIGTDLHMAGSRVRGGIHRVIGSVSSHVRHNVSSAAAAKRTLGLDPEIAHIGCLDASEVMDLLGTGEHGLAEQQAHRIRSVHGANIIAPEHLEICVDDPFAVLNSVQNAGSIFLGKNVPEALGDYFAGPNHTLPTSGTARFSSPLGVDDFVKKSSFIYYTREALSEVQGRIADFAEHEGLHAHAKSVTIRFE